MKAYMKAGAEKALQVIENKFFADGRTYIAGDGFTAAGMPTLTLHEVDLV